MAVVDFPIDFLNYYLARRALIYVVARINPQFSQFLKREMPAPQLPVLPRLLAPHDVSCLPGPLVSPTAILISPYPIPLPPVSLHAKIGRIAPLCPRLCNAKAIFLTRSHCSALPLLPLFPT